MDDSFIVGLKIAVLSTVFYTVLNIGLAFLVRIFPKSIFNPDLPIYQARSFEKNLYRKLRVAKWKDKFPEKGSMVGFSKRSLKRPCDAAYLSQFITETCIGELVHYLWGILGYLSLLLSFFVDGTAGYMHIFAIMATINLFIQLFFSIIQRYNRPRLIKLKTRLASREHTK